MQDVNIVRPPGGGRLQWMDLLRGTAIVLVLLWHAPAVPALFGVSVPTVLAAANHFFLPFRMPTLVFLSGLLLPASLAKNWRIYYVSKIQTLVWPYLIWSLLYFGQYGPIHPLTHWRAWYAAGYLWFLFFITVYYFIAPLVTKLLPMWLTPWLFMALSIPLGPSIEKRLLYFATFFFLGYWFASKPELLRLIRGWRGAVMVMVAAGWGLVSSFWGVELAYRGEFAALSIVGIFAACWFAAQAAGRWIRPLTFIGRNSLTYYVAHFPIMTLAYQALAAAGLAESPFLWLGLLLPGLVVPTVLALAHRSPWVSWLFRLPDLPGPWVRPPGRARTPVPAYASAKPPETDAES